MTDIKNLVRNAAKKLVYSDAPEVDAYELFEKATSLSANDILLSPLREISEEKLRLFDSYIEKICDLDLSNNILFPMTTNGRKIFYNSMFVKVFPDDDSVAEKCSELVKLRGK